MTHKPPVPDAAVSPYPIHPEPTAEKPVDTGETSIGDAGNHLARNIGIAAGAAIGSAAIAAALIYYNRPSTPAKRATPKAATKRTAKTATKPKTAAKPKTTTKPKTATPSKPRSAAPKPADKAPAKAAAATKAPAKPRTRKAKPTTTTE